MPLLRQHEAQARKGSRPCERALPGLRGINGKQAQRHGCREGMEQKEGTTMNLPYKGTAPTRAHKDDAGLDLRAAEGRWLYESGIFTMVDTGTAVDIPKGHVGLLVARSSLCHKGLMLANGVGIIDPGYHGTIKVPLVSFCRNANIDAGERIAQLVIVPIAQVVPVEVGGFEESERGNGGFGSTGRD